MSESKLDTPSASKPMPILQQLIERLVKLNAQQREYIVAIEDRLNNVLNKRAKEEVNKKGTDTQLVDFTSSFENELQLVDYQNGCLSRILDHLREII